MYCTRKYFHLFQQLKLNLPIICTMRISSQMIYCDSSTYSKIIAKPNEMHYCFSIIVLLDSARLLGASFRGMFPNSKHTLIAFLKFGMCRAPLWRLAQGKKLPIQISTAGEVYECRMRICSCSRKIEAMPMCSHDQQLKLAVVLVRKWHQLVFILLRASSLFETALYQYECSLSPNL